MIQRVWSPYDLQLDGSRSVEAFLRRGLSLPSEMLTGNDGCVRRPSFVFLQVSRCYCSGPHLLLLNSSY